MNIIAAIVTTLITFSAYGQVVCPGGVDFKEALGLTTPSNHNVVVDLNGVGLKKVLFVKVFYSALYLQNTTQNAQTILNSKQVKVAMIHALRSISKNQLINMWNDEYDRLCEDRCQELLPYHEKFLSYIRSIKKDERLALLFFNDRFELETSGGQTYDAIKSPAYGKILQRVTIGRDAKDKSLEDGLLGKKRICN